MNKYQRKYKDKTKATHSYNKGNRTLQSKRYRKKYDKKVKATAKVNRCILKGLLVKPEKCSLCKKKGSIHGHHRNYNHPYIVIWVCSYCHNQIHKIVRIDL